MRCAHIAGMICAALGVHGAATVRHDSLKSNVQSDTERLSGWKTRGGEAHRRRSSKESHAQAPFS